MKKNFIVTFILAAAMAFGCFYVTGCNLVKPDGGNGGTGGGDDGNAIAVSGVTVNPMTLTLEVGDEYRLSANVSPSDATDNSVSWSSGNNAVATVAQDGTVTAVSEGSVNITVTTTDGGYTAVCAVTVEEPVSATVSVSGVTISASAISLDVGGTFNLVANVSPDNATDGSVGWTTDNGTVATVAQDGTVTAVGEGTANITVTTADGGYTAVCAVTVKTAAPQVVRVDGVSVTPANVTLVTGATYLLSASVSPSGATDKSVVWTTSDGSVATVAADGTVTAVAVGSAEITVTTTDGNYAAKCTVKVESPVTGDLTLTYSYAGNECAAFEWSDSNPSEASVKYKLTTDTNYTQLDGELVRAASSSGTARADVVGLKGGATYQFVITSSSGKSATVNKAITAYDRSGYAHFNYSEGVGAYNNDGTPKTGAQIIYVSEATKNTVTAKIGSKTYTGICAILGGLSGSSVPVILRVIGTIGAATWNKIDYNASKQYNSANLLPSSNVIGLNGKQLPTTSTIYQQDLIDGGYNTLDTSVYSELIGLDSRAKYSGGEYDTIWNNCPIKNAKYVTLEGIGEDARLFQWGLTWGSCNSIEVRNLTFEDYTEDACSFEGSKDSTTIEGFNSKHIWIHHNTFLEGINYWDLCAEQDKHEGDGATDFKRLSYLTSSYNVHSYNHKTGLVGANNDSMTACLTFHHNYYYCNVSRLPLGRQANMHMYNNYYYGSTGTNMSLRANAYALIENCYFENANNPVTVQSDAVIKLYGNIFSGKNYAADANIHEVTDRTAQVANSNTYNQNFDTDSSEFYYDSANGRSDVSVMYTAEETKVNVPKLAGVQQRNGATVIAPSEGGSSSGTMTETIPTYAELLARTDRIYADDFSSYEDGYKLAELAGYTTAGIYSVPDSGQGYEKSYTEVRNGRTNQITNVGLTDAEAIKLNGKNTTTVIAFGNAETLIEGYFEMSTTAIGTSWDLVKFVSASGTALAVRIDTDKEKPLTYTPNGGTPVTPSQSFVWAAETTYKVYFKIDCAQGEITVNITDGANTFNIAQMSVGGGIVGIQLVSSNKGQRFTSIDNLVICGE